MHSTDAMIILIKAFSLEGVIADTRGDMAHLFGGDFSFAATAIDDATIRLSAQMSGLFVGHKALARRLLESNLSGVETGAGAMAPDPVGSGLYALVETVDITNLDADDFRLRVVDFMLYVEYWRAEGISTLRAEIKRDAKARESAHEAIVMRG